MPVLAAVTYRSISRTVNKAEWLNVHNALYGAANNNGLSLPFYNITSAVVVISVLQDTTEYVNNISLHNNISCFVSI
jgi:hypothetical protein